MNLLMDRFKKYKKLDKKLLTPFLVLGFILGFMISSKSNAEQMGSSPDSGGAESVLVGSYNRLVSKGDTYGSSSSPDWTYNWGTYWNRIMYSAYWEPDGSATESDVLSGKTFYSGLDNRTIKTGEASAGFSPDYSQESLIEYDDYEAGDSPEDDAVEESSWTSPATNVWLDTRTGLYWSMSLGSSSNSFTISTCDFYTSIPRGSYSGGDADCGNAINACANLTLTSGGTSNTDWYLPSQKELQEAYASGMYNQAGATFTTTSFFWSSTECSDNSSYAWRVYLRSGYTGNSNKTVSSAVRCVRRD